MVIFWAFLICLVLYQAGSLTFHMNECGDGAELFSDFLDLSQI